MKEIVDVIGAKSIENIEDIYYHIIEELHIIEEFGDDNSWYAWKEKNRIIENFLNQTSLGEWYTHSQKHILTVKLE